MAEKITTSRFDAPPSLGYSRVEFSIYSTGRTAFYGIQGGQRGVRLPEARVLESFGHDPSEREQPVEAIWHDDGEDRPVTVIGSVGYDKEDKQLIYKIEGSEERVPGNKLEWAKEKKESTLEEKIAELQERDKRREREIQELRNEVQELRRQVEGWKNHAQRLENQLITNGITPESKFRPEPRTKDDSQTDGEPKKGTKSAADAEPAADGAPPPAREPVEPPTAEPAPSRRSTWRDRIIGGRVRPRREVVVTRDVPQGEVVREREVVEREEDDRRRVVLAALGGAALVGAGVFAGWLIWGRHSGVSHEDIKDITKNINQHTDAQIGILKDQFQDRVHALNQRWGQRWQEAIEQIRHLKHTVDVLKHEEAREVIGSIKSPGGTHIERLNYYGDTVWYHAQRLAENQTSRGFDTGLIHKIAGKILHLSGYRWNGGGFGVDAHQLPIGAKLVVPNRIG